MPIHGDLSTMSLADLLQWAGENRKTGVLELERNRLIRRIEFRSGWVTACSADDPANRLGQFLLARGKITEQQLRAALQEQQTSPRNLGFILHQHGVLTQTELAQQIAAKAEELVQSLFDWHDALFRFHDGATLDPNQIEVRLSVRELAMRGLQHHEELCRIREVFRSSGTVLRRTSRPVPSDVTERPVARRIFESVDGERSLAEILLHAHAAEFLVLKLLDRLQRSGHLEIAEVRPPMPGATTILDPLESAAAPIEIPIAEATAPVAERGGVEAEVDVANRLIARGEHEAALELLQATYRAHPGDSYLKALIGKVEDAYLAMVRGHDLAPDHIPVPRANATAAARDRIGPQESFLLSLVDGRTDIRAILWLTPLREVDALKGLRRMVDRGLLDITEPLAAPPLAASGPADLGGWF